MRCVETLAAMKDEASVYSSQWNEILTRARMCRLTPPAAGTEAITIPRDVFDQLVRIVEVAARLQHVARPPAETVVRRLDGAVQITISDPILTPFTVTSSNLFQGLANAQARLDSIIEEKLR